MALWVWPANLNLLKRRTDRIVGSSESRIEQLKREFWILPQFRYETAALLYHYHCGRIGDPTAPSQRFRHWLIQCLELLNNPAAFQDLILSLSNTKLYTEQELELPLSEEMEKKLMALLWLSIPREDLMSRVQLQTLTDMPAPHPLARYCQTMALYKDLWDFSD
jgi:hypothetical protein